MWKGVAAESETHVMSFCFVCTLKNASRPAECCTHQGPSGCRGALSLIKQELVPSCAQLPSAEGRLRDACLEVGGGVGWGNIYKYIYMYLVPS